VAPYSLSVPISLENEKNPWIAAETRFDEAAMRLKLDDGAGAVSMDAGPAVQWSQEADCHGH
jgi:hypothetical protein